MAVSDVRPYVLSREEGEPLWLAGSTLSTLKATAEATGGALTLTEHLAREGMAVPLHTHDREDEAWYLLDGEVTLQVEDRIVAVSQGAFAFVPRGVPHGLRVTSPTARFVDFHLPGGFDGFVRAIGEPAQARELPPMTEPDIEKLATEAPRFGMTIVGPPPE
jgi:mannose-6-phosphate isomerase-like protein (cupin superfamily)